VSAPARIGVIDYGMGNRRSVEKALEHVGAEVVMSDDPAALGATDGFVLPGVGAFPQAMTNLRERGLIDPILGWVREGRPLLGVCLGMQLLFDRSTELGGAEGLGILGGEVRDLVGAPKLPHIGWNLVDWTMTSPLLDGLGTGGAFYHVHSLAAHPSDESVVLGRGAYGEPFVTAVASRNVFGAQLHPEKSSSAGLRLLENFTRICTRVPASSAQ
jgi:imidazole glycerol-phosphate synthase subunit HisH